MKTITNEQFKSDLITQIEEGVADEQTDDVGEIIIHTGMYEWEDGSVRGEADPSFFMNDKLTVPADGMTKEFILAALHDNCC